MYHIYNSVFTIINTDDLPKCRSRLAKKLTEEEQAEQEEQKQAASHTNEKSTPRDRGGGEDAWKWRLVVGSDLIIYAAGGRGLPLRFTAFRKQEQIERGALRFPYRAWKRFTMGLRILLHSLGDKSAPFRIWLESRSFFHE